LTFRLMLLVLVSGLTMLRPAPLQGAELNVERAVSVEDFRGRTLTLAKPARRIVCLIESALSGLFMLDAQDRIVGVSSNIYQGEVYPYYAAMDPRIADKSLPAPGNWDFVNLEGVVALDPDLVVIWAHQEESIRALEENGVPVFGVFIRSFEDVYREIRALGELSGTTERAEDLIRYTRTGILNLQKMVGRPATRPRVYFMWAQGELESSGRGSTVDELIQLAGGVNVCGTIDQEHMVVSIERIIEWDPEIIVMWTNERRDPVDILALPLWKGVSAVRSQKVHELPGVFPCDLWTLKFQLGIKMVAKWCHPEIFKELDLEKERLEVLARLYGEKLSLTSPRREN
jgi:iron complex transport system substrate-binding protein